MIKLQQYIYKVENWQDRLTGPPYYLKIQQSDNYYLLSPTIRSDLTNELVKEANIFIINQDKQCVCYPFPHIHVYHEGDRIAQDNLKIYQKIDGTLICFWNDAGQWHVSSQSILNCLEDKLGQIILDSCGSSLYNLTQYFQPQYCYTFMVTSPELFNVINYGNQSQLWYINSKDMVNQVESFYQPTLPEFICFPQYFSYITNLEIVKKLMQSLATKECGFLILDSNNNYMYIESDYYQQHTNKYHNIDMTNEDLYILWYNNNQHFILNSSQSFAFQLIEKYIKNLPRLFRHFILEMYKTLPEWRAFIYPYYLPCTYRYFLLNGKVDDISNFIREQCTLEEFLTEMKYHETHGGLENDSDFKA